MRDWHHKLIRLDQALALANTAIAGIIPPREVTIGVADSAYIEFEGLPTQLNGLNYKALNEGLKRNLGSIEKASLIRRDPINNIQLSSAQTFTSNNQTLFTLNNQTSSHGTSCAGIILGNKRNESNIRLPITGIIEDAKLMSFSSVLEDSLMGSISGDEIDKFVKTASILSSEYTKLIYNLSSSNDPYVPSQKQCDIISASIAFNRTRADENQLKVFFNVLKTYGNKGRGTIFIASAGNDYRVDTTSVQGYSLNNYPIIVSASTLDINNNEVVAPYSSNGDRVDLCAPSNNNLDPAESSSIDLGVYSTTRLYSGDIGTDSEVIIKQITNQTAADNLTLSDVDGLFPGNCVELGNPDTTNHEIMVIQRVDRALKKIYFSKPRTKTISPYVLAPTPASGSNPYRDAFRVPILKTTMTVEGGTSRNLIRVSNKNGFGYPLQEVCINNTSIITETNPPTKYFNTTITAVRGTNLYEIQSSIPLANTGPWEVIAGQTVASTSIFTINGNDTVFTFPSASNFVFDSFITNGMIEVVDTTNPTTPKVISVRNIKSINKLSKTISVDKYKLTNPDPNFTVSIRSIGYGSYTSSFGGTSAAAPVVSGVTGLLKKVNPSLNAIEIKHILKDTAVKIGTTSYSLVTNKSRYNYNYNTNNTFGAGRLNAESAVNSAINWHNSTTSKPRMEIADKLEVDQFGVTKTAKVATNLEVISPDIWIKELRDNSITEPTDAEPFKKINTSKHQKIHVKVRNTGDLESFKGYDLRLFIAFTDEATPAFPFPGSWYDQQDVKLLAIEEIDPIPAKGEKIIKIEWRNVAAFWQNNNPTRKKAYILAHIAPFDGVDTDVMRDNIRNNKQLSCKELLVNHTEIRNSSIPVSGSALNITVGNAVIDKNFELSMENIIATEVDTLQIKATRRNREDQVTEEVVFQKTGTAWALTTGSSNWIEFQTPTETASLDEGYKNVIFPHKLTINEDEDEIKLEIININA